MFVKILGRSDKASLVVALCSGFLCVPPATAQGLPDGPGKSDLQMVCTTCHSSDQIVKKGRRTAAQWQEVVMQMTAFGAVGSNAQMAAILQYLTSNYGRQPTPEEAAEANGSKTRPKEPSAKLPLAEARDLSGTWMTAFWYTGLNMGPKGSLPDYDIQLHGVNDRSVPFPNFLTPWAKAISDKFTIYTDPVLFCYSPGVQAYSLPYAFEIIPSPGRINMLMEAYHVVRRVYLDRPIPNNYPNPNVMGYSVGHWEAETLVVDTVGFNDSPTLRLPYSDQLHMVERIRRIRDGSVLEIEITKTDPKAYTQPLRETHFFKKDPSIEIVEHNCDGELDYSAHIPKTAGQ